MRVLIILFAATLLCTATACNREKKVEIVTISETGADMETASAEPITSDSYLTKLGDLNITLVGHASLMFEINGKIIHVDPYSKVADYSKLPKADLILITHEHADHLDTIAIEEIKQDDTRFIVSPACAESLGYGEVLKNGGQTVFENINIQAVPAYNKVHKRDDGQFYHPKGRGNGYVLTFGEEKVYIAGDTENIPEMAQQKGAYIAFLPQNLPYTMTEDMFIDAANKVSPVYLYPYHFSEFDQDKIEKALEKDNNKTKVLVRSMSNL